MLSRGSVFKGIAARSLQVNQIRSYGQQAAVSAAPKFQPSIFNKLFGQSDMPQTDLFTPFEGVSGIPAPGAAVATAPTGHKISTLPNGLRVVTGDPTGPAAHMGVFVDNGSRYETAETNGMSAFLELLAFKSSKHRSAFRLVRDTSKMGANISATPGRDLFTYNATCVSSFAPEVMQTVADQMLNPSLGVFDIQAAIGEYNFNNEQRIKTSTDAIMFEGIHSAAYGNTGLGLPLFGGNAESFTPEKLTDYIKNIYTADRMVVSASGVDHDAFVQMALENFGHLPSESTQVKGKAVYVGGNIEQHGVAKDGLVHMGMVHEGTNWHSEDLITSLVLQSLMGGGSSFSSGGPGKGMYSRLYTEVLNQHHWVHQCQCFGEIYSDTGLFGLYGAVEAEDVPKMAALLSEQFAGMAGPVDSLDLTRAKKHMQLALAREVESQIPCGSQMLTYGEIKDPKNLSKQIDAVSENDIQNFAKKMMDTPVSTCVLFS